MMRPSPLRTPAALAAILARPELVVLDCRHDLKDPEAGPKRYAQGHIPRAQHAHVDRALSNPEAILRNGQGRHPLPEPEAFRAAASRWGITPRSVVICYDDVGGAFAARAWWLLRDYGHENVAVLDGGWNAWQDEGHPVSTERPEPVPSSFRGEPGQMPRVDTHRVAQTRRSEDLLLIDVREATRWRGEQEPIDPVAGRIPGAINIPFRSLLDDRGRFHDTEDLQEILGPHLGSGRPAACYCGSGVTACHGILAAEQAGLATPALYPGSFSKWIQDPQRPVERN